MSISTLVGSRIACLSPETTQFLFHHKWTWNLLCCSLSSSIIWADKVVAQSQSGRLLGHTSYFNFALWLDKKVRATISTNQKLNLNQPWLAGTRFAALNANYLYLLQFLFGSCCFLFLLRLVRVTTLFVFLRHSVENRSNESGQQLWKFYFSI